MLQRPWQQFLPIGKDEAQEAGATRREAFFSLLKLPPVALFSAPRFSRLLQCGPPPPPPPPPLGRVLVYFSPSTPPIEAEQQQGSLYVSFLALLLPGSSAM